MASSERGRVMRVDTLLRRLAGAARQVPIPRLPLALAKRAAMPVRRALVGPGLDAQLRTLSHAMAELPLVLPSPGEPLNVAFLCAFGDASVGGVPAWTRTLAAALVGRGHRVTVLHLARRHDDPYKEGGVQYVPVIPDPARRWPQLPSFWPWLQDYLRQATATVFGMHAKENFHIISAPISLVEPYILLQTPGVPFCVSLHTTWSMLTDYRNSEQEISLEVTELIKCEKTLLSLSRIIIGNTNHSSRDIFDDAGVAYDARRVFVVPHGFPDMVKEFSIPIPAGNLRILFVGRLDPRKGIDTLLDAVPSVFGSCDIHVDIAGPPDGESPENKFRTLHAGAPWLDRVRFHGAVDDDTKWRLVASADIAVIPSRYESFGLVAVEAMMFGKPVISTRVGGIPEVVEDGVTGIPVPPGDAQALAEAMRRLIGDAELRARMGAAGRQRYLAKFTDVAMAEAWVAAVREGLARMGAQRQ